LNIFFEKKQETSFLYIPNSAVGAIIGTRGSHIRNIIRFSGASVKITSLPEGTTAEPQAERKVTIVGTPEAQWKAQYLIFEKMREEGFMPAGEDVRLTVELLVPSSQVGRIIGKGGQNVREMQRTTSSVIKLPEQGASTGEETTVHIIGNFFAVQSAQRRIRAMMSQQQQPLQQQQQQQQGAPMTVVSTGGRMRTSGGGSGGVSGGQGRGREQ
jgi:insulin-like growth factor 2 mRNA-binding protein 1